MGMLCHITGLSVVQYPGTTCSLAMGGLAMEYDLL